MGAVKIEIGRLKGFHSAVYKASRKQVDFIGILMARQGRADEFQKYFMINNRVTCSTISKASASLLINALKQGKEIIFIGHITIPKELSKPKIVKLYKPNVPIKDVRRITKSEQEALEQKYIEEL
jgi:hypothetical protein